MKVFDRTVQQYIEMQRAIRPQLEFLEMLRMNGLDRVSFSCGPFDDRSWQPLAVDKALQLYREIESAARLAKVLRLAPEIPAWPTELPPVPLGLCTSLDEDEPTVIRRAFGSDGVRRPIRFN